ncbi:hypothetical protein ACLOJK_004275 [Asimina triloba]
MQSTAAACRRRQQANAGGVDDGEGGPRQRRTQVAEALSTEGGKRHRWHKWQAIQALGQQRLVIGSG